MDDLTAALSQLLSNGDVMAQLRTMASSLGLGGAAPSVTPPPQPPAPDLSALSALLPGNAPPSAPSAAPAPELSALLGALSGAAGQSSPPAGTPPLLDANTLGLLQRAFSLYSRRDKNTELLLALRPHFSPERQKKVDDAVRMLGLMRLLPLVRESGILGKLFGGDGP